MKLKISKKYQNTVIFDQFELCLNEGKVNVLLGPSGCGKTTLLRSIANLCEYEGYITDKSTQIGYVFQEDRLFPHLTVIKNLLIIDNDKAKIDSYLKKFNVYDIKDKYPLYISGGEKQRISIIRSFLLNHDLILMDEPFKSLDFNLKNQLVHTISEFQLKNKTTIVLVTHDLDIAMYLGSYIHILSNKVTKKIKSIENVYANQELNQESVLLRNELKYYITL